MQHRALAALDRVQAGLDDLGQANMWSLSTQDLGRFFDRMAVVKARLAARELAAVAEADGRNIGAATATSTAGWLRCRVRAHPREAAELVRVAKAVQSDCRPTGAALAAGTVNAGQAQVITRVLAALPRVEADVRVAAEEFLIGHAAALDPVQLGQAGRALAETLTVDPDPDERARRQRERRYLHLIAAHDGTTILRGLLDGESAAVLRAALDPLTAPGPAEHGTPDPRTAAQRNADALTDLARHALAAGDLPASGGITPTVVVTIGLDTLSGQLAGTGLLPDGEALSVSAARRMACDAKIIPVVCGGPSQPLDIGRASRTVPPPMRRALVLRDEACAFPGCHRPPGWCESHHIRHWAHGGDTALHNLTLLCLPHHQAVHDHGWTVALDYHGLPSFRPPPWIDPHRTPRQHHRYRLRRIGTNPAGPDPPWDWAAAAVHTP